MTEEYIGEIHTDPSVLDEMAYACFWFENSTLEKELYREGIPMTERILADMLARVNDRIQMWLNFGDKITNYRTVLHSHRIELDRQEKNKGSEEE